MKSMCFLLLLLCSTFFPLNMPASDISPLSLTEAILNSDRNNPKIKAALSQLSAADHRITQARSGFLPQIYFTETFTHTNNPMWAFGNRLNQKIIAREDFDPSRLNKPGYIDNFNSALSIEWPVFQGGQTKIEMNQARLGRDGYDQYLTRTRQEVIATTAAAYTGLLLARKNLDVINISLQTAKANLKMISSRYEQGLAVRSDLLRAHVHIAELDQGRIDAQTQLKMAEDVLNAAMGTPGETSWRLSGELKKGDKISGSLDEWIKLANSNRPDMKYMQIQERIAEEEVQKSKASHLPNINIIGTYELNSSDFRNSEDSFTIGAMMRINLYSGERISSRTRETEALLNKVRAMRNEIASGIEVQIRHAFLQSQSAWSRIDVADSSVSQAEEGLRIVKDRYENGLLTIVSLLDAEVSLKMAQTNKYKSLHDYTSARIQLSLAAGIIDLNFE